VSRRPPSAILDRGRSCFIVRDARRRLRGPEPWSRGEPCAHWLIGFPGDTEEIRLTRSRFQGTKEASRKPPHKGKEDHPLCSSGDLPDLHGFQSPSTLSLLLDTVVGWRSGARRLARPSAKRIRRTTGPDDRLCHRWAAIPPRRAACSVAAASALGCGKRGCAINLS